MLTFTLFACEQDEVKAPFDNNKFYEDHQSANWTKETAKEHLQGEWKFIYIYCCGFGESNNWAAIDDGYFELQFIDDSVKVFTNGMLEQIEYWEFDERYENPFYLDSEENIPNTSGTLYFSENFMLFNGSPTDGADYYFQKID